MKQKCSLENQTKGRGREDMFMGKLGAGDFTPVKPLEVKSLKTRMLEEIGVALANNYNVLLTSSVFGELVLIVNRDLSIPQAPPTKIIARIAVCSEGRFKIVGLSIVSGDDVWKHDLWWKLMSCRNSYVVNKIPLDYNLPRKWAVESLLILERKHRKKKALAQVLDAGFSTGVIRRAKLFLGATLSGSSFRPLFEWDLEVEFSLVSGKYIPKGVIAIGICVAESHKGKTIISPVKIDLCR